MSRRKRTRFTESAYNNMFAYNYYMQRFRELAISAFKWDNLPETCDARYLEQSLYFNGVAVFFKEDVTGDYLTLNVKAGGKIDMYGNWAQYSAYGRNTYNSRILTKDDSVLIFNNMIHKQSADIARFYALKLYDIDRTIDINTKNARQPKIILCKESQKVTMENLVMQIDGGYNNIFADKELDLESVKVLDLQAPYLCDKLFELKRDIWNEALTYLGISNSVVNKKERLITDEVLTNQGGIFASRNGFLYERQTAAERINKLFGLNIKVDYNDSAAAENQKAGELPAEEQGAEDE